VIQVHLPVGKIDFAVILPLFYEKRKKIYKKRKIKSVI
jgi:hypothetical protein